MSYPIPVEPEQKYPEDDVVLGESPKQTIMELMDKILLQTKDLEENVRQLKEDAFNIFPKF